LKESTRFYLLGVRGGNTDSKNCLINGSFKTEQNCTGPFHALFAAYRDFLTLWKDADPDIPILKQTKAEYAKLQ
jgi:hypothetical protein